MVVDGSRQKRIRALEPKKKFYFSWRVIGFVSYRGAWMCGCEVGKEAHGELIGSVGSSVWDVEWCSNDDENDDGKKKRTWTKQHRWDKVHKTDDGRRCGWAEAENRMRWKCMKQLQGGHMRGPWSPRGHIRTLCVDCRSWTVVIVEFFLIQYPWSPSSPTSKTRAQSKHKS